MKKKEKKVLFSFLKLFRSFIERGIFVWYNTVNNVERQGAKVVIPEKGKRISKTDTYLNCAETFAYRSTCLKRKYGENNYVVVPACELEWYQNP